MIGIHFESSSSSAIESYIRNFNNENQCLSPGRIGIAHSTRRSLFLSFSLSLSSCNGVITLVSVVL